ncbi:hypothetical protein BD324DRAFT_678461 [Kockovaella imperatae]|uniref:Uncharacterized protein n=1 Tax=Kockovaella imperatae TaxID=4999 RepID=A0A1Y1UTX1_9TREE|nr:hypothetical protein BD324DRAFT_678461 [Kockovaella imperatae]ORX41067.1 hypothetical protein BD324DRAFT_678461 [Kockovaella imperatae]
MLKYAHLYRSEILLQASLSVNSKRRTTTMLRTTTQQPPTLLPFHLSLGSRNKPYLVLPTTPRGWAPLREAYDPSHLPTLPPLLPHFQDMIRQDHPELMTLARKGDAIVLKAIRRAIQRATSGVWRPGGAWENKVESILKSNNVFAYLAISLGIVTHHSANHLRLKRSADLFEAYLGAYEKQFNQSSASGVQMTPVQLTVFLDQLFKERVWRILRPALPITPTTSFRKALPLFPTATITGGGPPCPRTLLDIIAFSPLSGNRLPLTPLQSQNNALIDPSPLTNSVSLVGGVKGGTSASEKSRKRKDSKKRGSRTLPEDRQNQQQRVETPLLRRIVRKRFDVCTAAKAAARDFTKDPIDVTPAAANVPATCNPVRASIQLQAGPVKVKDTIVTPISEISAVVSATNKPLTPKGRFSTAPETKLKGAAILDKVSPSLPREVEKIAIPIASGILGPLPKLLAKSELLVKEKAEVEQLWSRENGRLRARK